VRRRGRTRSSSRPPPTLHSLSLVCSLGLSPRLPFAHSPRATLHSAFFCLRGASRLRTSRTASPRPGSPPPAASGSPRGHVPCLCLISPENRVHAAGGRITRRCSRLARACSSALRAGKRAPAAERHPLAAAFNGPSSIAALWPSRSPSSAAVSRSTPKAPLHCLASPGPSIRPRSSQLLVVLASRIASRQGALRHAPIAAPQLIVLAPVFAEPSRSRSRRPCASSPHPS
jgi:hypothetical protein